MNWRIQKVKSQKKMKPEKAAGLSCIVTEMIKADGDNVVNAKSENRIPDEWNLSYIVT